MIQFTACDGDRAREYARQVAPGDGALEVARRGILDLDVERDQLEKDCADLEVLGLNDIDGSKHCVNGRHGRPLPHRGRVISQDRCAIRYA